MSTGCLGRQRVLGDPVEHRLRIEPAIDDPAGLGIADGDDEAVGLVVAEDERRDGGGGGHPGILLGYTIPMLIRRPDETPGTPVALDGVKDVTMRMMVGRDDGAPNFSMRHFTVEPGGHTPHHSHNYEHEVVIVEGEGEGRVRRRGSIRSVRAMCCSSSRTCSISSDRATPPSSSCASSPCRSIAAARCRPRLEADA